MAIFTNTAEAGVASGTPITSTEQTGGAAGTAFDSMTSLNQNNGGVTFDSDSAHGSLAYRLGFGSGSSLPRQLTWNARYGTRHAMRWYTKFSALGATGSVTLASLWYATQGVVMQLQRQADGSIRLYRGGVSVGVVVFTSAPLNPNTWYRFEYRTKQASGVGVANGEEEFAIFEGDSPEPIPGCYFFDSAVNNNVGRQVGQKVAFVDSNQSGDSFYVRTEWYDDMVLATDEHALEFVGPVLPAPVTSAHPYVVTDNSGGWVAVGGDDLIEVLSDDEDASYARSPGATEDEVLEAAIPPITSGALRVVVRAVKGSTTSSIRVEVLQGSDTVIATRTFNLTDTMDSYELNATSPELAMITDRSKLRVRVTGNPV
jgi:hypothetical protein